MKKLGCFLAVAYVFTSTPAFARDLTLFGGVQRAGKLTLSTSGIPATIDPKSFGTFGLRAGIGKRVFGSETTVAYSPNFIDSQSRALIFTQNLVLQAPTPG